MVCCCARLLAPWPCQCSHPQPSWKTTNWLLACVLWSRNPTPGTFLQSVPSSLPAAPGAVRRRELATPTYHSFSFKGADLIRLFCCAYSWDHELLDPNRISRGFWGRCRKHVRVPSNKGQISVKTADLEWGEAPVGATCNFSCVLERFGKVLSAFGMQFQIITLVRL